MSISVNWTAASCIVALLLGLLNGVHSWIYEKHQRKREIRDKALDAALQLWTVSLRFRFAKDRESITTFGSQLSGLFTALKAYGYPVDIDLVTYNSDGGQVAGDELARIINTIVSDAK